LAAGVAVYDNTMIRIGVFIGLAIAAVIWLIWKRRR